MVETWPAISTEAHLVSFNLDNITLNFQAIMTEFVEVKKASGKTKAKASSQSHCQLTKCIKDYTARGHAISNWTVTKRMM